jgi:diguanylate cyclase (GGDEF)-like protein
MMYALSQRQWPAVLATALFGYTAGTFVTRQTLLRQVAIARASAEQDPLTGLPNRRGLLTEVRARLTAHTPTVLALIDLDDFKTVNDTYGHTAGDDLLTVVGARLRTAVASHGYAARLAGDEFVLLLSDGGGDPAAIVGAVLSVLAEPVELALATLRPQASAGVVTTGNGSVTWRNLITRADHALYQAKANGKNIAIYHHGSNEIPRSAPQRRRNRLKQPAPQ